MVKKLQLLLLLTSLMLLTVGKSYGQCLQESVFNGSFNANLNGWTKTFSGTEGWHRESNGTVKTTKDNTIDELSQNINVNVIGGYIKVEFDIKVNWNGTPNSTFFVNFDGTDYLRINFTNGGNPTFTTYSGAGVVISREAILDDKWARVAVSFPYSNGIATNKTLKFTNNVSTSSRDITLDNISVKGACYTDNSFICDVNAVSNGKFENNTTGWTMDAGWNREVVDGNGVMKNSADNAVRKLKQSISNVGVHDGRIYMSLDVKWQHYGTCPSHMEVWFAGTKYIDIQMVSEYNITITDYEGTSHTNSAMDKDYFGNIQFNFPWTGTSPASGDLEILFNTAGPSGCTGGGSDGSVDNIFVSSAACMCDVSSTGSTVDYCEAAVTPIDCETKYRYYLPAVGDNGRNDPSQMNITTEAPVANFTIKYANGTVATSSYVTNSGIYSYSTSRSNMFSPTYETAFNNRGFIIESDQPITVMWLLLNSDNRESVVLRGQNALGTAFRAVSAKNTTNNDDGPNWVNAMATEDSTVVQMGAPANLSAVLNRGQQLMYADNKVPVSGILVTSSKPIVVNSGQQHKQIYPEEARREGTAIQLLPIKYLGKEYIMLNHDLLSGYQVVAVHNGTKVYQDGALIMVLNAGESFQNYGFTATADKYGKPFRISTSEPAYVYNLGSTDDGEFEMFQAPAVDLPMGKGSIVTYPKLPDDNKGWILVDSADYGKLKRNGLAISPTDVWTLLSTSTLSAKKIAYWRTNTFAPNTINTITCDSCNSLFVGVISDGGIAGAIINYVNSFDIKPIQFYNTNLLPLEVLTNGYRIDTIDYNPLTTTTYTHTITEATSAGSLEIKEIVLTRASGSASVGSVSSISGLDFTLNLPPASSLPHSSFDTLNVFVVAKDIAGNEAGLCLDFILMDDRPLNTNLLAFDAIKKGLVSELQWKSNRHENVVSYNVERSSNGKDYQIIGSVMVEESQIDASGKLNYATIDNQPLEGLNYYRIGQVKSDNTVEYSAVRLLKYGIENVVTFYPNPTQDEIKIKGLQGDETIEVYNNSGRLIMSQKATSDMMKILLNEYIDGLYYIRVIENTGNVNTQKVMKIK